MTIFVISYPIKSFFLVINKTFTQPLILFPPSRLLPTLLFKPSNHFFCFIFKGFSVKKTNCFFDCFLHSLVLTYEFGNKCPQRSFKLRTAF